MAYLLLYVDDIVLTASSDALRHSFAKRLASEFAMKDMGPLHYFLGVAVTPTSTGLFLNQEKYAAEILERAGMASCKPSATPMDTKSKLSSTAGTPYDNPTYYRSLAGALQYLTFTRPDLSYAVQQVQMVEKSEEMVKEQRKKDSSHKHQLSGLFWGISSLNLEKYPKIQVVAPCLSFT